MSFAQGILVQAAADAAPIRQAFGKVAVRIFISYQRWSDGLRLFLSHGPSDTTHFSGHGSRVSTSDKQGSLTCETLQLFFQGDDLASRAMRRYLYQWSRRHAQQITDREDLTQQTLLNLLSAPLHMRTPGQPDKMVRRYVYNTMTNAWVKLRLYPNPKLVPYSVYEEAFGGIADPQPGPAELVERRQDRIEPAMDAARLTHREKDVMRLVSDGCARRTIAVELGIGMDGVKKHRANACKKLRAVITADETGSISIDPSAVSSSKQP